MTIIDNPPAPAANKYHFYFLVDSTGSMSSYLHSLSGTLEQLFDIMQLLFPGDSEIHLVSYKDYCDPPVLRVCHDQELTKIKNFISTYLKRAGGGGDAPEASKTALNYILDHHRNIQGRFPKTIHKPIVFHYTDAPPHCQRFGGPNFEAEAFYLTNNNKIFNWMALSSQMKEENFSIFTVLPNCHAPNLSFHSLMGDVICLEDKNVRFISKATIGILTRLMGEPFIGDKTSPVIKWGCEEEEKVVQELRRMEMVLANPFKVYQEGRFCSKQHVDYQIIKPVPGMDNRTHLLKVRFKKDVKYQDFVFDTLERMFTPEKIIALTYNPVLGKLWRLVCCFGSRKDERLMRLQTTLSRCSSLCPEVKKWIEESYDYEEEINSRIEVALETKGKTSRKCLVVQAGLEVSLTGEDVRSLARAPVPGILKKFQTILTHLVVVDDLKSLEENQKYLPLCMANDEIFSLLPHLVSPGTLLNRRGGIIIALILVLSGNKISLRERAQEYLAKVKGTWNPIDTIEDYPELMTAETIRLIHGCSENETKQYFTDEELSFYRVLYKLQRLRQAASKKLPYELGYTPALKDAFVDKKIKCAQCKKDRSFTITQGGVCGLCLFQNAGLTSCKGNPKNHLVVKTTDDKSHMVQCHACSALYAVLDVRGLNVQPKCHYCRNGKTPPTIACTRCKNKYVNPDGESIEFLCPLCESEDKKLAVVKIENESSTLKNLSKNNKDLLKLMGFMPHHWEAIFGNHSFYKLYVQQKRKGGVGLYSGMREKKMQEGTEEMQLVGDYGKRIVNIQEFMKGFNKLILEGSLLNTCYLCFEDVPLNGLRAACGNCPNQICMACAKEWYGGVQPGKLVLPSNLSCPFCKQKPKGDVLKKYNKLCMTIFSIVHDQQNMDMSMYYGWCVSCYKIKEMMARVCGGGGTPNVTNFECADCMEIKLHERNESDNEKSENSLNSLKHCPSCEIQTIKSSGCDHMTCPCGCHWCYRCEGEFRENTIYNHIYECY